MFHGRKRTDKQELTPDQLAELDAKLEKIAKNNQILLKKRADKEYTMDTLR